MSLHDAYARLTPHELGFPDEGALRALAAAVAEEAPRRNLDASELDSFMRLESVGAFLEELRAEGSEPETLLPFAALLFHALHFLGAGRPLFLSSTACARELVAAAPAGEPEPPARAGYLQLPQHMFWMTSGENAPPESLDGFFWSVSDARRLHVLAVTGLRPERPGFGAVPLAPAPLADAPRWLSSTARPADADFRSSLPGAELDGLVQVETTGEVLKLLARFFARAASLEVGRAEGSMERARDLSAPPTSGEGTTTTSPDPGAPRASALPYTRVPGSR